MNDNNNNGHANRTRAEVLKKEKTLLEIFQLILKNKYILFATVFAALAIALAYAFLAEPKYEAKAVIKKETNAEDTRFREPDI